MIVTVTCINSYKNDGEQVNMFVYKTEEGSYHGDKWLQEFFPRNIHPVHLDGIGVSW